MRALLPLMLLPLFAGCGSLEAYTFTPHEGLWRVSDSEIVDDDCGLLESQGLDVDLQEIWLEVDEPTRAFHTWVDDSEPAPCDQLGDNFACEPAVQKRDAHESVNLSVATTTDGWFDSPMDMSGDFSMRFDCHGSDCASFAVDHDLADFPCVVTGVFDASAVRGVSLEDR